MRRITIYAAEDDAAKAVGWLEQNGFDFMSEDFAEPTLQRRSPPTRRAPPERTDERGAFLTPLKQVIKDVRDGVPIGSRHKRLGTLSKFILNCLAEAGTQTTDQLIELAKDRGFKSKQVRDTIRRLRQSGRISQAAPWART